MTDKLFAAIATEHLGFPTLDDTYSGRDFREVSVWGVRAALAAAYKAGLDAGQKARRS